MNKISGRTWRFGENVDTDQIIPAKYLTTSSPEELAKHVFENMRADFSKEVREGDIIVAGKNFGCGSSREHAPRAILGTGIACVIASSFARIFFRNAINVGLPAIQCEIDADEGDEMEIDFDCCVIRNLTKSSEYAFNPMPDFLMRILDDGLVNYVRTQINSK
jgi:3-isopropylmalate/(R)-2-methylmalate dehydratase small subunit